MRPSSLSLPAPLPSYSPKPGAACLVGVVLDEGGLASGGPTGPTAVDAAASLRVGLGTLHQLHLGGADVSVLALPGLWKGGKGGSERACGWLKVEAGVFFS